MFENKKSWFNDFLVINIYLLNYDNASFLFFVQVLISLIYYWFHWIFVQYIIFLKLSYHYFFLFFVLNFIFPYFFIRLTFIYSSIFSFILHLLYSYSFLPQLFIHLSVIHLSIRYSLISQLFIHLSVIHSSLGYSFILIFTSIL